MNSIQVADTTFVVADPAEVGRAVSDAADLRRWFPDLRLTVREDRGPLGVRWTAAGAVVGTTEVWLQPMLDGVLLHYFLHGEPAAPLAPSALPEFVRRRRVAGRVMAFEVKRRCEADRPIGAPRRA